MIKKNYCRINQRFVIATKTKVDISKVKVRFRCFTVYFPDLKPTLVIYDLCGS